MFYDHLDALCAENGLTVTELMKLLGLSPSSASRWKTKGFLPSRSTAKQIADYFGISVAELMGEETETEKEKSPVYDDEALEMMREMYERPELRALFKTSKKVKPEDIKAVDQILKRMAEGYRDD